MPMRSPFSLGLDQKQGTKFCTNCMYMLHVVYMCTLIAYMYIFVYGYNDV